VPTAPETPQRVASARKLLVDAAAFYKATTQRVSITFLVKPSKTAMLCTRPREDPYLTKSLAEPPPKLFHPYQLRVGGYQHNVGSVVALQNPRQSFVKSWMQLHQRLNMNQ
jgi:hypothetical protein